jgi:hypothetical protein
VAWRSPSGTSISGEVRLDQAKNGRKKKNTAKFIRHLTPGPGCSSPLAGDILGCLNKCKTQDNCRE